MGNWESATGKVEITMSKIEDYEKDLKKEMEKALKNKKYNDKITPLQQKFIDSYCSRYGEWSATQCAIHAGYDRKSAHTRASELLDWKKHPDVALEIQGRLAGLREAWDITRDKHLAMLTKIRDEARIKGQYGTVAKCEELRGRVAGLYIERNLVLRKELTTEEIEDKMKSLFPNKKAFLSSQDELMKDLFDGDDEEK